MPASARLSPCLLLLSVCDLLMQRNWSRKYEEVDDNRDGVLQFEEFANLLGQVKPTSARARRDPCWSPRFVRLHLHVFEFPIREASLQHCCFFLLGAGASMHEYTNAWLSRSTRHWTEKTSHHFISNVSTIRMSSTTTRYSLFFLRRVCC